MWMLKAMFMPRMELARGIATHVDAHTTKCELECNACVPFALSEVTGLFAKPTGIGIGTGARHELLFNTTKEKDFMAAWRE